MPWIIEHLGIATGTMVVLGIGLVVFIFLLLTRIYPHESTRPLFGSALVSILVTVLFSVVLNNWYAIARDKQNRLRALRDQHFGQLKPVLRAELSKLQEIALEVTRRAHFSGVAQFETNTGSVGPRDALWPDLLSPDLQHHFPAYDKSKHDLLSEIEAQDEEFRIALLDAEREIKLNKYLDQSWREVVAVSFVESCTGRGEGVKVTLTDRGYEFRAWTGSNSNQGGPPPPRPSPVEEAALNAFQSLRPEARLNSHCDSLKHNAEGIIHHAQELSKEAQLNSESTILKGNCDFLKSDSLSD